MAYKDKEQNKLVMKCYHKALGILKKIHEKEFKKIFYKLLKGGKNGK